MGLPGAASMEAMRSLPFIAGSPCRPGRPAPAAPLQISQRPRGRDASGRFPAPPCCQTGKSRCSRSSPGQSRGGQAHFHPSDLWNLLPQGQHPLPGLFQVFRLGLAAGGFLKLEHDDVLKSFLPSFPSAGRCRIPIHSSAFTGKKQGRRAPGWKNFSRGHTAKFSPPIREAYERASPTPWKNRWL